MHPSARLPFILVFAASLAAHGQHQTAQFDDPVAPGRLPFSVELREVTLTADVPTLHSHTAAHHAGQWLLLAGRTNGLHGLTGRNAFDPAFENREVWVIDPRSGQSWRKSLADSPASGLSADVVDSLSAVNTQFIQTGDVLYVVGGYGYKRSIANHTTYPALTAIDVPGLAAWVKAAAGSEGGTAASHIRQIEDPFFKVTGGGLERIGDEYQLIFGQDYEGAYRPFLNGVYTHQVRRFKVQSAFPQLALVPGSKLATPQHPDYRRRDLNVLPILERDLSEPGRFTEKAMVLGGVFTVEGGVWTLPVIVGAGGGVTQMDPAQPGVLRQSVQQYHCVKVMLFHRATNEMHALLFGGISLKFWDAQAGAYLTDENAPFVNDVTDVVRYADGSMRQFRLPFLFPDIRAPWNAAKPLLFGTNAEFFHDPDTPLLTSKIVDLARIGQRMRIGWIHGGIIADAPNFGATAASGHIFEVWLTPADPAPPAPRIAAAASGYTVAWQGSPVRGDLLEASTDLVDWTEARLPAQGSGAFDHAAPLPAAGPVFHRLRSGLASGE